MFSAGFGAISVPDRICSSLFMASSCRLVECFYVAALRNRDVTVAQDALNHNVRHAQRIEVTGQSTTCCVEPSSFRQGFISLVLVVRTDVCSLSCFPHSLPL
jgi:hypothetical protein